jgi:ATP-dependent Zn protease
MNDDNLADPQGNNDSIRPANINRMPTAPVVKASGIEPIQNQESQGASQNQQSTQNLDYREPQTSLETKDVSLVSQNFQQPTAMTGVVHPESIPSSITETNQENLTNSPVTTSPHQFTKPTRSHKKLIIAFIIMLLTMVLVTGFIFLKRDKVEAPKTTDPSITKQEPDQNIITESDKQASEAAAKQALVQDIDLSISSLESTVNESNDAADFNTSSLSATTIGIE